MYVTTTDTLSPLKKWIFFFKHRHSITNIIGNLLIHSHLIKSIKKSIKIILRWICGNNEFDHFLKKNNSIITKDKFIKTAEFYIGHYVKDMD
jgi:hypothetical protein